MSKEGEGQRRSARILAKELEASKSNKPIGNGTLLTDRKRNPKRKRLADVVATSVPNLIQQNRKNPKHEITSGQNDQQAAFSSSQGMPDRRILEFVLDMLQMRDTREIFTKPVDPKEVEGYYNVIKEPMDFCTMRAKLQEGQYTSLEQFESDVFLISSNAMRFNSSTTVFYREARAIHELAERAFHVLRTEPDKLQLELSLTKKHSTGRKIQVDEGGGSHTKLSKSSGVKNSISQNGRQCSSCGPSLIRKKTHKNIASSTTSNSPVDKIVHHRIPSGSGEIGQRQTYRPWTSFISENELIVSEVYKEPNLLVQINHGSFNYKESLMLFVKDLGPTAQMVAKRKLANSLQFQTQNPVFWSSTTPTPPVLTSKCLMIPPQTPLLRTSHLDGPNNHQEPQILFHNFLEDSNVNRLNAYANKKLDIQGEGKMVCANGSMDFHSNFRRGMVPTGEVIRVAKKDTTVALQGDMVVNIASKNKGICGASTSGNMDLFNATVEQYISQQKQKAPQINTGFENLISLAGIRSSCTSLHGFFSSHFL